MIIIECDQNSPEWHQHRLDNPGASEAHKIITPSGAPSTSFESLLKDMANQIIDGEAENHYYNRAMEKGHEREEESRKLWQMRNNVKIEQVGLIFKDENRLFHCSPDGIMPDIKWGFESKNAKATVQHPRLKKKKVEGKHWVQCQMSLYVTGYKCWVYQSYCRGMETLTIDVYPDYEFIKKLEAQLYLFVGKLTLMVKEYKEAA
jgi:hypothetical protein